MTNYKRLTMKFKPGVYHLLCLNCPIGRHKCKIDDCKFAVTNRLGELEDKIESGELREVPRGAVILTSEELEKEVGAVREERVEFERRIELLKNELNRELSEHKAFIEKTAIEVGRLKAEKERAVKEFVEKPKELSEFRPICKFEGKDLICNLCPNHEYNGGLFFECRRKVTRPPQSWCYVEELCKAQN